MIRLNTKMEKHGVIFQGHQAEKIMIEFAEDVGKHVAADGAAIVRTEFAKVVKHPTGHYSRNIGIMRYGGGWIVHDNDVIYGPWLAGTGSMNFPHTRFRGYAHWRRAVQQMRGKVKAIARGIKPRYIRKLSG